MAALLEPHDGAVGADVARGATEVIARNKLAVIGTYDEVHGQPCSFAAYYAYDSDWNLYVWTGPATLHGKNLGGNSRVSVAIVDSRQRWGAEPLVGLQAFGEAARVADADLERVAALYLARFPHVGMWIGGPAGFSAPQATDRLYRVALADIKVVDERAWGPKGARAAHVLRAPAA